ncbi:hypothetical protein HZC31_01760 [Candidatus Woesearchaeota archaeon]|nr:hypothetical protein [Candidatus Woesearchaeota archaeon]
MNVFEKISNTRQLLQQHGFRYTDDELFAVMRKLGNEWHYKKQNSLTQQEAAIYELLMTNSINPNTAYKWLLLIQAPQDVQKLLETKRVSQRNAFAQKREHYLMKSTTDDTFLNMILDSTRRYLIR